MKTEQGKCAACGTRERSLLYALTGAGDPCFLCIPCFQCGEIAPVFELAKNAKPRRK